MGLRLRWCFGKFCPARASAVVPREQGAQGVLQGCSEAAAPTPPEPPSASSQGSLAWLSLGFFPLCADKGTESRSCYVTCPRSHRESVAGPGTGPSP